MRGIVLCLVLAASITPGDAQETSDSEENKLSVGFALAHHGYDPAFGFEITSRPIIRNHIALRLRGNIQMMEAYKAADDEWISYQSFCLALVYQTGVSERTRFYVELGGFALVPDNRFTSRTFLAGMYELNGLEIFLKKSEHRFAVFLAAGPAIINARAEKLAGQPKYGNGLIFMNGVRFYF